MKEKILFLMAILFVILWFMIALIIDFKKPFRIEELSVEERIKYEQMAFP